MKVLLCLPITAHLAKSRPQIVERRGMTGIELEQPPIRSDRLGISALSQVFIALGKKVLGRAGVGPIRWRASRIAAWRRVGLILGDMQDQRSGHLIGRLPFDAVFEQPPFEGGCERRLLKEIQS